MSKKVVLLASLFFSILIPSVAFASGVIYYDRGAVMGTTQENGGPGFFVNSFLDEAVPTKYGSGVSWYATAWPLSAEVVPGMQIGLSSTWITPRIEKQSADIAQRLCDTSSNQIVKQWAQDKNPGNLSGYFYMQTIEGSLGWWANQKFPTLFPKYMPNVVQNCYTTELATPGWQFFRSEPLKREQTGVIQLSNQIVMPPDGMTLQPDDSGPQLGTTWLNLSLSAFDHRYNNMSGPNNWTLFLNSANFKGPVMFIAPQFWADGSIKNPAQKGLGLDKNLGGTGQLTSEWNSIPYASIIGDAGKVYTKIPPIQFPSDSNGDLSFARDFRAYSATALGDISSVLNGSGSLPKSLNVGEIYLGKLTGNSSPVFQRGLPMPELRELLSVKSFENGASFGLNSQTTKSGMVSLPQYFVEENGNVKAVAKANVPRELVNAKLKVDRGGYAPYIAPEWWENSTSASPEVKSQLNDGSVITYRWYKFVDQPALQRFEMNESEKKALQSAVVAIQTQWSENPMMKEPTKGALVNFDAGMIVKPPQGLEVGYVPIVLRQERKEDVDRAEANLKANQESQALAAQKLADQKLAAKKSGTSCSKLNAVATVAGYKFTCIKSGKKLVWNKGVKVVTPQPTPSLSPTKFQAAGCHAKVSAVLQILNGSEWKDLKEADGWAAISTCPSTNLYQPYVTTTLSAGTFIRWHIFAPGQWEWYSDREIVLSKG